MITTGCFLSTEVSTIAIVVAVSLAALVDRYSGAFKLFKPF